MRERMNRGRQTAWLAGVVVSAAMVSGAAGAGPAPLPDLPEVQLRDGGVQLDIRSPMALDAARLLSMKPGDKIALTFPVFGRKVVVFEATTQGADGLPYWHGRLEGAPLDRVYLKQVPGGFVGGVRLGGRQVALRQQGAGGSLTAADEPAGVATQLHQLGAPVSAGVYDIRLNAAALADAPVGSELAVPLPDGQTEVIVVTGNTLDADGHQQLVGISRMDGPGYPTLITVGTDAVFAAVHHSRGEHQIITRAGRTQIIDPRRAGWRGLRGDDQMHIDDVGRPPAAASGDEPAVAANVAARVGLNGTGSSVGIVPLAAGQADTTINLLMTYSPSFVTMWGSESAARTRLANLVSVANAAYLNSGTGVQFRVVGWQLLRQADTSPQTNLSNMRSARGVFSVLPRLRQSTGAAISVFAAPFNAATSRTGTCGVAYVPGAGAGGLLAYQRQAPSSLFTAINDGQHGGAYCEALTLAHELGHNLGAVHDRANSSFAGVFNYSYGKGVYGLYGTVMSYVSPRVALFSSPHLTCAPGNVACGTAQENVVATVLQTKAIAAAQGRSVAAMGATDNDTMVAGWLLRSNGQPYNAAATVQSNTPGVACTAGTTGLYVCRVPPGVAQVTVTPTVRGRRVVPAVGTFNVQRQSNMPITGARFYVH